MGQQIELTASDGHVLSAYYGTGTGIGTDSGLPGLVILQEIFGVTPQMKEVADRYCAAGFDVVVPALLGFCWGGGLAYWMAQGVPVDATV